MNAGIKILCLTAWRIPYNLFSILNCKKWIFKAEILELLDFQRKSMYYNLT
uniref:Uncharacterized protein n=1 Tax=Siphoviridae sp. ctCIv11 TaxID=2827806 RepID=A0A8S5S1R9_9CAUD|nr:MAG TPA: hypothetical protein [Siphoviridae sp. ctCIv11]